MIKEEQAKVKEGILAILERFPFYRYAAKINGIDENTLLRWRDEDKAFGDRCEASRSKGLMNYANRAKPEFMLSAAEPETFKERVDVTSGDKPIPILPVDALHPNNSNDKTPPAK